MKLCISSCNLHVSVIRLTQRKTRRRDECDEFSIDDRIRWKTIQRLAAPGQYRQHDSGTLSKRFRKDKMDIYQRINMHILKLLASNAAESCLTEILNRYIQNFVEYSKELFVSQLKYSEKRKLFFYKGKSSSVLKYENKAGLLSFAQRLLLFSLKTKIFFPVYCVFCLKEKSL